MVAQTKPATLEDLAATPDDGRIYELLNGEIVVSAAPTFRHQLTLQVLNRSLDGWTRDRGVGTALMAPTDVVLDDGTALQPDLFILDDDNPGELVNGRFHGAPDLAVEIISPTSRSRDATVKAMRYARAGVREFWLADPDLRTLNLFILSDGIYSEIAPEADGSLHSIVLAGLRIDPAAVFEQVEQMISRRTRKP